MASVNLGPQGWIKFSKVEHGGITHSYTIPNDVIRETIGPISSTRTGRQPDSYLQQLCDLQKGLPIMRCYICNAVSDLNELINGKVVCKTCEPSLLPNEQTKWPDGLGAIISLPSDQSGIRFLQVNHAFAGLHVDEGIYEVDICNIRTDAPAWENTKYQNVLARLKDDGRIVVSEKLQLIQGFRRVSVAKQLGQKTIVVRVVDTTKPETNSIKDQPNSSEPKRVWSRLINELTLSPDLKPEKGYLNSSEFDHLVQSVKERGILNPITIDTNSRVIDGAHRLLAAQTANLKVIPCYVVPTEYQIKSTPLTYSEEAMNLPLKELKMHPSERGKVRCLEPDCKTWITVKDDLSSGRWFCTKHKLVQKPLSFYTNAQSFRGYEDFPFADRDGDAIWVQKDYNVVKINRMEDSHLTNTLVFIETNAKKRCELTGLPIEKWMEKAGPRYRYLLEEAKMRDEKLKCQCDDGILMVTTTDPVTLNTSTEPSLCSNCVRGENRRKAKQLALFLAKDASKRKKTFTVQVATMMVVALLAGAYTGGFAFVNLVISYLKELR